MRRCARDLIHSLHPNNPTNAHRNGEEAVSFPSTASFAVVSSFLSLAARCKFLQFVNASRLLASRHRAVKSAKLPLCFHLS